MIEFTVSQGREGAPIEDGTYIVILSDIKGDPTQANKPKTVTAQRGPKAGQDIELWDWVFAIDQPGTPLDGTIVESSTSTASGPKSKMYAYLTALNNGRAPAAGSKFSLQDLRGRRALATIRNDDQGWPRIENLSALPASMLGAKLAEATGTVTNQPVPTQQPVRETVAAGAATDDLPF